MERDSLNSKGSFNQQFNHSQNIYKNFQNINQDQDDLLIEDTDQLVSEKMYQKEDNSDDETLQNYQNNVIKVVLTKSQKKQKKQNLLSSSNFNTSESIKRENIVFQQLIKDSDNQCVIMTQELEENVYDQENTIDFEFQMQNKINNKSDPILVVDDNNQMFCQYNLLSDRNQLNCKRPFFKLDKENQNTSNISQPKTSNKILKKDINTSVSREIYQDKKQNHSYKKNIYPIFQKQTQLQKKQQKFLEKFNTKQQKYQTESLKQFQSNFKFNITNDIENQL